MKVSKLDAREESLIQRRSFVESYIDQQSQQIVTKLKSIIKAGLFTKIGIYYPIDNEVDVLELMNDFACYIPQYDEKSMWFNDNKAYTKEIANKIHLSKERSNILEDINSLEYLIIPGVAFDTNFNRVGFGKGYYDKFLKSYNGIKIGVTYDETFYNVIELDDHDIKMDYIVTPSKISKR